MRAWERSAKFAGEDFCCSHLHSTSPRSLFIIVQFQTTSVFVLRNDSKNNLNQILDAKWSLCRVSLIFNSHRFRTCARSWARNRFSAILEIYVYFLFEFSLVSPGLRSHRCQCMYCIRNTNRNLLCKQNPACLCVAAGPALLRSYHRTSC